MLDLDISQSYASAPTNGVDQPLIIACGAIAAELIAVLDAANARKHVEIQCLPAIWHNRPERIAPAVAEKIAAGRVDRPARPVFVAYADCGTGGLLDAELAKHPGVERLPGAHCYAFFAGLEQFDRMMNAELGTFFLTDYLARHFRKLVWAGMGLEAHPELKDMVFGHYTKVVYLCQIQPAPYLDQAQEAAELIGAGLEVVFTSYGALSRVARFAT